MATADLIVIGGGSGGAGAALTAAGAGLRTVWVEREGTLGGTGVHALVNCWQPSYGISPLARLLAGRLLAEGHAILTSPVTDTPDGRPIYRNDPTATYDDSLRRFRSGTSGRLAPAVTYEPAAMARLLRELAVERGVELLLNSVFLEARTRPGSDGFRQVGAVLVATPDGPRELTARYFIDATADLALAQAAGCDTCLGAEAQDEYGESLAPPRRQLRLNGWSLCFLCQTGPDRRHLPGEPDGPTSDYAHVSQMPHGGYHVNPCFQIPGEVAWQMGPERAREALLANLVRRWPLIRRAYGLEHFGISLLAPRLGVREGPRLRARCVLTEHDHARGDFGRHHGDCVAFTDHALDRHSPGGGCIEATKGPVGVPLASLQPREYDNLLVTSRGAGFSSVAASALRLQRTIMEMGEGAAAAIADGRL